MLEKRRIPLNENIIGMIRRIDDLGRVVIPKELRTAIGINAGDELEIFVTTGKEVVIRKVVEPC